MIPSEKNTKLKYKRCCGRMCLLYSCKTREEGGCYCLCSLKDYESSLLSLISGHSYQINGCIIFEPNRKPIHLEGKDLLDKQELLENVRMKIKEYEE